MRFLKKSKSATARLPDAVKELPNKEDHEGNRKRSFIRNPVPKGSGFNKKVVIILTTVVLLVFLFSLLYALQPVKKKTPEQEAEERLRNVNAATNYTPGTPESVNSFPVSYNKLADYESQKKALPTEGQVGNIADVSTDAVKDYQQHAQEGVERKSDMTSLKFNVGMRDPTGNQQAQLAQYGAPSLVSPQGAGMQAQFDQNMQREKIAFVEKERKQSIYLQSALTQPMSPHQIMAGTIIPGVMITGINSDLPGQITAQVRENVYDTVSGKYLLVPQGTRMVGMYDSKVAYGQERVLIVWTRLIMPDGSSIDLEGMQGVDMSGYSGLADQVNNHWGKLITGVVLSSVFAAGTKIASGNDIAGELNFQQQAATGAAENVARVGERFTERNLNIQPTIEIRPGLRFNIFVNKDMVLRPYPTK